MFINMLCVLYTLRCFRFIINFLYISVNNVCSAILQTMETMSIVTRIVILLVQMEVTWSVVAFACGHCQQEEHRLSSCCIDFLYRSLCKPTRSEQIEASGVLALVRYLSSVLQYGRVNRRNKSFFFIPCGCSFRPVKIEGEVLFRCRSKLSHIFHWAMRTKKGNAKGKGDKAQGKRVGKKRKREKSGCKGNKTGKEHKRGNLSPKMGKTCASF